MKKLMFGLIVGLFLVGIVYSAWTDDLEVALDAYYEFENTTATNLTLVDAQGNFTGNLSVFGGTEWISDGKINFGLLFGGNEKIVFGSVLNYTTNTFTFSGWVKPNMNGSAQTIISKGTSAGWTVTILGTGNVTFGDSGGNVQSDVAILNNTWTHIVTVYDGDAGDETDYHIYINGTEAGTTEAGIANGFDATATNLTIGALHANTNTYINHYRGTTDEFGIWSTNLSATNVTTLYNSGSGLEFQGADLNVTLLSPIDGFSTTSNNVTFVCIVVSDLPIANVSFILNGVFNDTNTSGVNNTNYTFNKNIDFGDHTWTCASENNESAMVNASTRSFSVDQFTVTDEDFNITTFETESEVFTLNITTVSNIQSISSFLNYNGTLYAGTETCSGVNCFITRTIDIPLVTGSGGSENKTFFWQISVFDGDTLTTIEQNTSTQQQNVSRINFGQCGTGTKAMNISFFEETNQTAINASFDGTFTFYFGSGTVTKQNVTINSSTEVVELCVDESEDYLVTSQIRLSATGYVTRLFDFFEETYSNSSVTQKNLYLLNSTGSSDIIIEVKNQGLKPMVGILVNISLFLPETGEFIQVESQLTDDFGQFVANLIENDAKYKFEFYDDDGTLLKTSPVITIACRASICIIPFVIEVESDEFDEFEDITDYLGTLSFDNSTNTFAFSWDDKTGDSITTRLEVIRYTLNGSSVVCNITSTSSLDILSCAVGSARASYKAQAFRKVTGEEERRMAILNAQVGSLTDTFGVEGLIWVFLLLFTMLGIGVFNPTVGLVLYGIGFLFIGIMGIISMPVEVFFANTLIVVVFIWGLNRR